MDKLYFPNGLVLSPDEEFLVVAETGTMSLLKYYLKGEKIGKTDILIDSLPGLPDNLTPDPEGIWVPLVMAADRDHPNGFAIFSQFPLLRLVLTRFLFLVESTFQLINSILPNKVCQRFIHFIGHGESFKIFSSKRSTVIRLDWKGNIVGSLHGYDGSVGAISHVLHFKNMLLLGSPFNHFLARIKLPNTSEPNRVRISSTQHSAIELESSVNTEQKNKISALKVDPKPSKPKSKQSYSKIKDSKLEELPIVISEDDFQPLTTAENLKTEKTSKELPLQPAPVKEEIKVDTKFSKPEKLKVINKERKYVEL